MSQQKKRSKSKFMSIVIGIAIFIVAFGSGVISKGLLKPA